MQIPPREPRQECPAFLVFVRTHRCCVCPAPAPSHAAHIRMAAEAHGKRSTGMQEKPHDRWCVPLCERCHLYDQHRGGERAFWLRSGIDPFVVACRLWEEFTKGVPRPAPTVAPRKPSRASRGAPKTVKRKWPSRPIHSRSTFR